MKKMNGKMIFMLFSIMWGCIQEQTTNFEYFVLETWPRTCGRVVFKFYKTQTKSKNHETCQDVKISYVEAVIKKWGGFAQVVTYDACKPKSASSRNRLNALIVKKIKCTHCEEQIPTAYHWWITGWTEWSFMVHIIGYVLRIPPNRNGKAWRI